jgi:hypothetical protein
MLPVHMAASEFLYFIRLPVMVITAHPDDLTQLIIPAIEFGPHFQITRLPGSLVSALLPACEIQPVTPASAGAPP